MCCSNWLLACVCDSVCVCVSVHVRFVGSVHNEAKPIIHNTQYFSYLREGSGYVGGEGGMWEGVRVGGEGGMWEGVRVEGEGGMWEGVHVGGGVCRGHVGGGACRGHVGGGACRGMWEGVRQHHEQ